VDDDVVIVRSAHAKQTRAQLSAFLLPYRSMLDTLDGKAPSYFVASVRDVLGALDHWADQEKEMTRGA